MSNELRAYDPTWRDRVAAALIGEGKPSRYYRDVISGLVGSAGIGGTGYSLSDLTPAGTVFSADEMVRSARDGNYGQAALDAASIIPAGVAFRATAKFAKGARPFANVGSRVASVFDPRAKNPRPFHIDYPTGALADEAGNLTRDIEGRPLVARYIAGRRLVGGANTALSPTEIRSIGTQATGRPITEVPQRGPTGLGSDMGRVTLNRYSRRPEKIFISENLTPQQRDRVLAHEVGHVIDQMAGEIPVAGLSRELAFVYDALLTGQERTRNFTGPQHLRYRGDEVPREYIAEASRAYMVDPNWLKTVAPKTAARIREYVNSHPELSKIIQFNSLAATGIGSGSLLGTEKADAGEAVSAPLASKPATALATAATVSDEPGLFARTGANDSPGKANGFAFRGADNIMTASKGEDGARVAAGLTSRNSPALDALLAGGLSWPASKVDRVARALLMSSAERR